MKNSIVRAKCVDMSVDGQGIAKAGDLVIFVKEMITGDKYNERCQQRQIVLWCYDWTYLCVCI